MSVPPPRPPKPPAQRLRLREIVFLIVVAVWVIAVALTDRAMPLTPPVVPYATMAGAR